MGPRALEKYLWFWTTGEISPEAIYKNESYKILATLTVRFAISTYTLLFNIIPLRNGYFIFYSHPQGLKWILGESKVCFVHGVVKVLNILEKIIKQGGSVLRRAELVRSAKLSVFKIFKVMFILIRIHGYEIWVRIKRVRSRVQTIEMRYLWPVKRQDWMRNVAICSCWKSVNKLIK